MRKSLEHDHIFKDLAQMCRCWGGELIRLPLGTYNKLPWGKGALSRAPFVTADNLALDWGQKRIYYTTGVKSSLGIPCRVEWASIIHEMGHVFATREDPDNCTEVEWFAWEYMIARQYDLGTDWFRNNQQYGINGPGDFGKSDFGDLTSLEQMNYIISHIPDCIENGLLNNKLEPQALR